MQQFQSKYHYGTPLSINSSSSLTSIFPNKLNGIFPSHCLSQTSASIQSITPNQSRLVTNCDNELKLSEKVKYILLIIILTFTYAFLLTITIELATTLVKYKKENDLLSSMNEISNLTQINNELGLEDKKFPIRSFFACIWLFHVFLFFICLLIHLFLYQQYPRRGRARAAFLRECLRIFDNEKFSSHNKLIDYLLKTGLLSILWYLSFYLIFRSMAILVSSQIIILYSIKITLRQMLGWIFLHEQFIGNKIIAHILALSALLLLSHDNGFRFNRFLLGLSMITCAVAMETIFDILINGLVKNLTNSKYRIVMINVCLCGTCLLWPFVLFFHVTELEPIVTHNFYSSIIMITLICALLFNMLTITIPFKYTSFANAASFIVAIPCITLIDRYLLNIKYSALFILAILCSLSSILLSMIPKQWFQTGEALKMKQALGLINKDLNTSGGGAAAAAVGLLPTGGTTNGTTSAFEEIKTQRRIRNALLYNELKT
ncbi:unnamed protein product [Rotaria magnacalcarata]|uniref:Uncharacterized protein n=3 Tax=Rotaria magnacalcarata TaxID=392030 RepID=A0A816PBC4_9BILA|nr:unnamed protein product [Rotaria magnacalcarata]CAF1380529.1 unnamed protein product [Rotaria magnacalcarata]CAF2046123.1 unnamed protein product [Rotaria magnacalcarata]CAF3805327.1 unnamed protein product [Rotaria magnacalcarata]CAF4293789.1 unnamed protein product [Rotaria magnacalcarata]